MAGAAEHEGFLQQLRLMEGAFKLSAKDLRSQVVREACITLGYEMLTFTLWPARCLTLKCVAICIFNCSVVMCHIIATDHVRINFGCLKLVVWIAMMQRVSLRVFSYFIP